MLCLTGDDWEFRIRGGEASYATSPRNTATSSVHLLQDPGVHIHTVSTKNNYIFSLSLIYFIVFVCYLFSKQVDFFNSCFFIPFILVFVSCTGWHFCETVSFSMVMVQ